MRFLASAGLAGLLAFSAAGCTTSGLTGASRPTLASASDPRSENDWRQEADVWGARYRADPRDAAAAMKFAKALSATERRAQAVSVLEQASLQNPHDMKLLGAYGRALAEVGRFDQAIQVLGRAHSPDRPDWRVLSAHGAVLDQMGRHEDAQRYYASALKIAPDEPTVLSNLGLSFALAKNLEKAEATLRKATALAGEDPRMRQNLALVIGLQGRFAEAEDIARADLPSTEAAANVAYLRRMLADRPDAKPAARQARIAAKGQS